jgi:uncharacterized repeat protein (TIGR02543 family)
MTAPGSSSRLPGAAERDRSRFRRHHRPVRTGQALLRLVRGGRPCDAWLRGHHGRLHARRRHRILHPGTVELRSRQHDVWFDTAGGSDIEGSSVAEGFAAAVPSPPTRAGHTFDGWFTSAAGAQQYDFSAPVSAATTIYAQWSRNSYLVTFHAAGGNPVTDQRVSYGPDRGAGRPQPFRSHLSRVVHRRDRWRATRLGHPDGDRPHVAVRPLADGETRDEPASPPR